MLNLEKLKEMFSDFEDEVSKSQIFIYKDGLTYDISKTHKDICISDSKGNTICVLQDGSQIRTKVWAEKVSKKLDKASDIIIENFNIIYQ